MAIRDDLPALPPRKAPSFFNVDAAVGVFGGKVAGMLLGMGVALLFPAAAFSLPAAGALLGMAAGGYLGGMNGKRRMESEMVNGRPVHQPTYFNKGLVAGLGVSLLLSVGLTLAAVAVPALALPAVPFIVPLVAAVGGSLWRRGQMEADVTQATAIKQAMGVPSRGVSQYMNSVSPQEAQQLSTRISEGRSTGFADAVAQQQAAPETARSA